MRQRMGEDSKMVIPEGQEEEFRRLVERFRAAGAHEPESWARSEILEDIPQLARYCFLRSLWPQQIDRWRQDTEWLGRSVGAAEREPNGMFADAGLAIKRLLALGATREELASIARMVAYDTAFGVVYRIDACEDADYNTDAGYPAWTLSEMGRDGLPTGRSIGGLHEDLLTMDPSGREGRPA